MITQKCKVPVYGLWDSYLGSGILGGKLVSGYAQGKRSAELVLRIIEGNRPDAIPVEKQNLNEYMFDYDVLQRFSISTSRLPKDSIFINKPLTFYSEYKNLIWATAGGIILLSLTILILALNILRRIKAETNCSDTQTVYA